MSEYYYTCNEYYYTCNGCKDNLSEHKIHRWCNDSCGKTWCSPKCSEADGYVRGFDVSGRGDDNESDCKWCRGDDVEDDVLLMFALKRLGQTRDELLREYNRLRA